MEINNLNGQTLENTNAQVDITKTPGRDVSMDIASLLKANKEETPDEKSALQKMKEAKEKNGLGLIVDNEEIKKQNEDKKLIANKAEADAYSEIDAYNEYQDKLIEAAKSVTVNTPRNPQEMAVIMDTLDTIATTGKIPNPVEGETPIVEPASSEDAVSEVSQEDIEKQSIVEVLIDKTGLGGDFKFTEEEQAKLMSANTIRLKEVQEVNLETIKIRKPNKSFMESVDEFQIATSKVPVTFPASRFRAEMTGLTYGEMGDIALNGENITFEQVRKRLTVIYNKMVNPSIGKFADFEDFLHKFAYIDIDLATYGLVVASFPEVDDIPMTCNNPKCGNSFYHKYSPRTLIRFDKSSKKFLQTMKDVATCPAADAVNLQKDSPTQLHTRYRLPYSGFIIEIGIASSYDYLYTIIDNVVGDKFTEAHPDDVNGILQLNSALLGLIRTVYVPDGDEYVEYDNFEDMINALYMIKPEEIGILSNMLQKFTDNYTVNFEFQNIVCPHCKTKTPSIAMDINYLVFLKYQRLMSTETDVENITVL